jgi:hypothetical protein
MDFPSVVWRLVGQYAVASLADLSLLFHTRLRHALDHPLALAHVSLEFRTFQEAVEILSKNVLSGVRQLTLESTCNQDLARLATLAPNLRHLDLGRCDNLRHTAALTCLHRLRTLQVRKCHACAKFFEGLQELSMYECSPIEGDLGTLQKLKLHACVVNHITRMNPNLTSLDLHSTSWVDQMDKMTVWGYEGGWTPDRLHELKMLQELKLSHCEFVTDEFASSIGHLKNLHTLAIDGCFNLTNFNFIAELPALQNLDLTDVFDWTLFQRASLRTLTAPCRDLAHLSALKHQTALRTLRLRWHYHWGAAPDISVPLSEVLLCLPHLHTLDLSYWVIQSLPACESVRCLVVDSCRIKDPLVASFPNLHALSMAFAGVTNASLSLLPPTLRLLRIRGCAVTDEGLRHLDKLPQLRSLDISGCNNAHVVLPKTVKLVALGNNPFLDQSEHLALLRRRRVKLVNTAQFQTHMDLLLKRICSKFSN